MAASWKHRLPRMAMQGLALPTSPVFPAIIPSSVLSASTAPNHQDPSVTASGNSPWSSRFRQVSLLHPGQVSSTALWVIDCTFPQGRAMSFRSPSLAVVRTRPAYWDIEYHTPNKWVNEWICIWMDKQRNKEYWKMEKAGNVEVMRLNIQDACSYNFIIGCFYNFIIKCLSKCVVLKPLTVFTGVLPTSDSTIPARVV